jgi:hypothetical protein
VTAPAIEVRSFAVTIPAGTAANDPYTQEIWFPAREVLGVHWKVPPGPSGLMGWRLTMSGGTAVLPTGGGWIITDNDSDTWNLQGQPDSGYWEVTGYNTGIYNHTVYLDFLLDIVGGQQTTPALIPNTIVSLTSPTTVTAITSPIPATITSISTPLPVTITSVTTPYPLTVPAITVPSPVTTTTAG